MFEHIFYGAIGLIGVFALCYFFSAMGTHGLHGTDKYTTLVMAIIFFVIALLFAAFNAYGLSFLLGLGAVVAAIIAVIKYWPPPRGKNSK